MKMLKLMKIFPKKIKKKNIRLSALFFHTDTGAIQFALKCSRLNYAVSG